MIATRTGHAAPDALVRVSRDAFLQAALADKVPTEQAHINEDRTGLVRSGRPYLALACGCGHAGCPGWALVVDEPHAIAHFRRLFEPRAPQLPFPPAPPRARATVTASAL